MKISSSEITDKTRKILWGKAAGRCSRCRMELVFDKSAFDDETIVGEECHIVAQGRRGPRREGETVDFDVHGYENLILLCRNDHKIVDSQPETFTAQDLMRIKHLHEEWVRKALGAANLYNHSVIPFPMYFISTGKVLLNFLFGSTMTSFDNDELDNEKQASLIGDLTQNLRDYLDIWGEIAEKDKMLAQLELDKLISELSSNGFVIYGTQRIQSMRNRNNISLGRHPVFYLHFFRTDNESILREEQDECTGRENKFKAYIFAAIKKSI